MSSYDNAELQIALDALENKEYAVAVAILLKIAETGNPKAQCNLATCYHLGLGVTMHAQRAIELYMQVAEQNITEEHLSAIAYTNMAAIYESGFPGIEADRQKAAECHRRARELGFPMSMRE
jgi:TPR repeat protein